MKIGVKNDKSVREMMLTGSLTKVILKMAYPSILAMIISSIYSLADTYFVSSLGTNATAAVSVNSSIDNIIMMAGSFLAVGANSYIARLLGAGDKNTAERTLATAFFISMGIGSVLLVGGLSFLKPMVRFLGATETCEQYSMDYARFVLLAAPFMAANFVLNQCLRSEGHSFLSMVGMGVGGIINIILDPIFIFGGLGLPAMGVAGASMATAISKLISFILLLSPYLLRKTGLHLTIRQLRPSWTIIKQIAAIGSSALFRSLFAVVAAILMNRIAGQYSDSLLAGIGVSNKIMMFPFGIILGYGTGYQPVVGFNYGSKHYARVTECYKTASRISLIGAVVMAVILMALSRLFIHLFAGDDAEMVKFGSICIISQAVMLPVHAWVLIINMLCSGMGRGKDALLLSVARQGLFFIPTLLLLRWLFAEYGIAVTQAVADLLTIAMAIPIRQNVLRYLREAAEAQKAGEGEAPLEPAAEA
ncbi:MAG: MATE family efflux transporter [Lachnospiraceae bacterium]|nr:MATE family efflux transporter [Lachnospiraceae bacterium]